VNHIGVQVPACLKTFEVGPHWSKEWAFQIVTMPGKVEIVTNPLRDLRVNGETPLLAAFAHHLQRIEATVHVEVTDFQTCNPCPAKPDLQSNCQDGAVTNT